jgi:hypothetical protein
VTAQPLTDAEFDERERRLRADAEDARQTLNRARAHYEQLCDELRDLRIARREQQKDQP